MMRYVCFFNYVDLGNLRGSGQSSSCHMPEAGRKGANLRKGNQQMQFILEIRVS